MSDLSELLQDCVPLAEAKRPNWEFLAKARELEELGFERLGKDLRDRVLKAEKLGSIKAEGYLCVTNDKINAFLRRKAQEYNESVVKKYGKKREAGIEEIQKAMNTRGDMAWRQYSQSITIDSSENERSNLWFSSENEGSNPWSSSATPLSNFTFGSSTFGMSSDLVALTHDFLSPSKERIAGFMWQERRIDEYEGLPPAHALTALKTAKAKEIFDYFTIASVSHVKDPLLLGRINGSEDRFFLAQWGDDVALDDVI